jgi:O-antigen/teichoic acid export membrane protein
MSRTRRSVWNLLSGFAAAAGMLVLGLLSVPLLLRWVGDERLGAFRAASDWTGSTALIDLGLAGGLQSLLAAALGRKDQGEAAALMTAGVRVYSWAAVLVLLVGIGLAFAMPSLVAVPSELVGDLRLGCWLNLLGCLFLPLGVFRSLAEANQRGYLVHGLILLQSAAITGLSLLFASGGWGITGLYASLVLGGLIAPVVLFWNGWRRHAELRPSRAMADGGRQAAIVRLSGPLWLIHLSGRLSFYTDNIVVSYLLGPAFVVPFVVTQRLVSLAGSQAASLGNATWAALAELHAQGKREDFNRRLTDLTRLAGVLCLTVVIPTTVFNHAFVSLWVGPERFAGEALTMLTGVNAWLLAILGIWTWVFAATGQTRWLIPNMLVGAGVNVVCSIGCTMWLGLIGPLAGTAIQLGAMNLWWLPLLLRRHFGTPLRPLAAAVVRPMLLGLPYALGLWSLTHLGSPRGWLALALCVTSAAGVFVALSWWLVLSAADRAEWRARLRVLFWRA